MAPPMPNRAPARRRCRATSDTEPTTITPPDVDVAITKVVDDPTPALNGTVTFTITATNNTPGSTGDVRDLLIEAIRYGDQPEVRAHLTTVIDDTIGEGLDVLMAERALHHTLMADADVDFPKVRLSDGDEVNGSGLLATYGPTDPLNADTDGDGINDGVEAGVSTDGVNGGTSDGIGVAYDGTASGFVGDADPDTTTDPADADSDNDGLPDGVEDLNADGQTVNSIGNSGTAGSGETDPNLVDTDSDLDPDTGVMTPAQSMEILAAVEAAQPGRVIEVELERDNGRWVYELKIVDPRGRLVEAYVDAKSG